MIRHAVHQCCIRNRDEGVSGVALYIRRHLFLNASSHIRSRRHVLLNASSYIHRYIYTCIHMYEYTRSVLGEHNSELYAYGTLSGRQSDSTNMYKSPCPCIRLFRRISVSLSEMLRDTFQIRYVLLSSLEEENLRRLRAFMS